MTIGQPGQERFDFRRTHLARVAQAVEPDEPAHPVDIRALGAQTVVGVAQPLAQLVEQAGRAQRWRGAGYHGSGDCKGIRYRLVKPRCATVHGSGRIRLTRVRFWLTRRTAAIRHVSLHGPMRCLSNAVKRQPTGNSLLLRQNATRARYLMCLRAYYPAAAWC